jgi:hypothetical protein
LAGKFFVNMQGVSFISAPNTVALSHIQTWIRRDIPLQLRCSGRRWKKCAVKKSHRVHWLRIARAKGPPSFFRYPHLKTEAELISEKLLFNYKSALDESKRRLFRKVINHRHIPIELKRMNCIVNYSDSGCEDVYLIKVT